MSESIIFAVKTERCRERERADAAPLRPPGWSSDLATGENPRASALEIGHLAFPVLIRGKLGGGIPSGRPCPLRVARPGNRLRRSSSLSAAILFRHGPSKSLSLSRSRKHSLFGIDLLTPARERRTRRGGGKTCQRGDVRSRERGEPEAAGPFFFFSLKLSYVYIYVNAA